MLRGKQLMLWLPQHRLLHQTHDSGIHTLNPHTCNPRPLKTGKRKKPEVTYPFEFVTSGGAVCSTAHGVMFTMAAQHGFSKSVSRAADMESPEY